MDTTAGDQSPRHAVADRKLEARCHFPAVQSEVAVSSQDHRRRLGDPTWGIVILMLVTAIAIIADFIRG